MNREIKFRLWDPENGMGQPININEIPSIAKICLSYGELLERCIWLQYTGILDKNSNDIYENPELLEETE